MTCTDLAPRRRSFAARVVVTGSHQERLRLPFVSSQGGAFTVNEEGELGIPNSFAGIGSLMAAEAVVS